MYKKIINYEYLGFWEGFDFDKFINENTTLAEKYIFKRNSGSPDFVFYSCFLKFEDLNKYNNAVRIFYSGENVSPDFIYFDYWIGFDFLKFGKRYFRYPLTLRHCQNDLEENKKAEKKYFCNFCYHHDRNNLLRKNILDLMNSYKKVNNIGSYLNTGEDIYTIKEKRGFQKYCKFSIVIESTDCDGFITEKIADAMFSNTIPIYFGTDKVFNYFNKEKIIYGYDFKSNNDLLNYIIEIDKNDDLFYKILNKPIFAKKFDFQKTKDELTLFLDNIFSNKKIIRETNYSPIAFCNNTLNRLQSNKKRLFNIVKDKIKRLLLKHWKKKMKSD